LKLRAESGFALGWIGFGALVAAASWRMDRLQSLSINPLSAPGLMPGVLGILIVLFGGLLLARSLLRKEPEAEPPAASAARVVLALALCVGYAAGLLGRGLPFSASTAAFLLAAILAFRWLDRGAESRGSLARIATTSAAIAIVAAIAIGLVFEKVFLVRLP
jgi:hypothetical protein